MMAPKRKAKSDVTTTIPKKLKASIIDDPVAAEILKELKVSYKFFNSGKVLAWALSPEDPEFLDIHEYVARGQEHGYGIKILSILRIMSKADDYVEFDEMPQLKDKLRQMLFHGTKPKAVTSILEGGLKLPLNQGQMFGQGLYLADRVSKSANYCGAPQTYSYSTHSHIPVAGSIGYIFLADVLLGTMHERQQTLALNAPPPGFDSVKGVGLKIPDAEQSKVVGGCTWPMGPTINTAPGTASNQNQVRYWHNGGYRLQFNEFIVYNPEYVQPKFLLKVEFTAEKHYEKLS